EARHGIAGRSDDHLRVRPPTASRLGAAAPDQVALQHLSESGTTAWSDHAAERLKHHRGALPCPDRVSLFRRPARWEAHLLGVVCGSFGCDKTREEPAVRGGKGR